MAQRRQVRNALADLKQGIADATGEGAAATVVLVPPSPEFPEGQRVRKRPTGRVVEIVHRGGNVESGIEITAPLPGNTGKIIIGVDPIDLV